MAEVYVVHSKIRALARKKEVRCSSEALEALSRLVEDAVARAVGRAKANNRRTIKGMDI